ncbi:ribosomal protein S18-alanine N-acetyltransferase [Galactobacillus timonensis]|uniref:ribosomal protein S18-alanine N-acetyltransferase n=1 Tax=Galactobacillus timonensis TaxID=2041840 RepID=UPI001436A462|nr:ribosomal protein S18-alanine N-acetyltransferase [Galactobacillus timonensis]
MIRRLTMDDLDAILHLESDAFPKDPWPKKEIVYELQENPYALLAGEERNGRLVGYCDLWIMYEQAQVANIAVSPSVQRQGIGASLMDWMVSAAIEAGCENLSLEVRLSNLPALRLYEKYGFLQANIRRHYYEDGEDAYLMVKPLGGLENDSDTGN